MGLGLGLEEHGRAEDGSDVKGGRDVALGRAALAEVGDRALVLASLVQVEGRAYRRRHLVRVKVRVRARVRARLTVRLRTRLRVRVRG